MRCRHFQFRIFGSFVSSRIRVAGPVLLLPIILAAVFVPCPSPASEPALQKEFASPPARYGPSCNWWWFGGVYSINDIRENLDAMKAAGLGGFRIFPVYPLAQDDAARNILNAPYLSPEFLQLVREAVQYGGQIGLTADSLLGDGWPFGGPYIPPEFGAGQLKFYSQEVAGGRSFSGRVPGEAKWPEKILAVQAAEMSREGGVRWESLRDLTARVRNGELRGWDVPAGRWLLMTFVSGYTGMKVKRAAVGGEGLVLDHFSREALDLHLRHNGDVQKASLRGAQSIFMDSWEVFGSNWTPKLPEEFQKRRGYSLIPHLAALFLPTGAAGARVRYDFWQTLSELASRTCLLLSTTGRIGMASRLGCRRMVRPRIFSMLTASTTIPRVSLMARRIAGESTFATGSWPLPRRTCSAEIKFPARPSRGFAARPSR